MSLNTAPDAQPLLVALRGMPGVGKSLLAQCLGRELGWPVLDKDDIKDVLYGRTDADDELAYDVLFRVVRRQLQLHLSVLCDSPLLYPSLFALAARTAAEANGLLVVLDCALADEAEHRRRIEARGIGDRPAAWGVSDWGSLVAYRERTEQHANYPLDVPFYSVDLRQPLATAVREATAWLRSLAPPSA